MSKKHHFVPRSLLRGFSIGDAGQQVVVFDKLRQLTFPTAIADAGAENHFNTVLIDGVSVNLEGRFDELDDRLGALLAKMRQYRHLSCLCTAEREQLAFLAVIQLFRVKLARTTLMEFPNQLRATLDLARLDVPADAIPPIDENAARRITFEMLGSAMQMVPALLMKNWMLCTAPTESPFWISDCPIVTANHFPCGDLGLQSLGVEVTWPLSRDLLISFVCPSVATAEEHNAPATAAMLRSEPILACPLKHVEYYNSLQVLQSSRFLYGPTDEFALARQLLEDHPKARQVLTKMSLGSFADALRREQVPPGAWLMIVGARTHHSCRLESWSRKGGRALAIVAEESAASLARAIVDTPLESITIFEDGNPRLKMREVAMVRDDRAERSVTIMHADPAIDSIAERVDP